jgi:hypothetical protein
LRQGQHALKDNELRSANAQTRDSSPPQKLAARGFAPEECSADCKANRKAGTGGDNPPDWQHGQLRLQYEPLNETENNTSNCPGEDGSCRCGNSANQVREQTGNGKTKKRERPRTSRNARKQILLAS